MSLCNRDGILEIAPLARPAFGGDLKRRNAYEEVAEELRRQIFARRLRPQQRLPTERELTEQFGVSRTAIREAIRSLESAGLLYVKKGPKGGIFVAQAYERPVMGSIVNLLAGGEMRLEDLFEVRSLIEPYCAARAAEIASVDDIQALSELVLPLPREDGRVVRARNIAFHKHVLRMSGNPLLAILGEAVLTILNECICGLESLETSQVARGVHKEIVKAITARRPARARQLIQNDLAITGARFAALSSGRRST